MKLISHRGNVFGAILSKENTPQYISTAIESGYDVEIDVWVIDEKIYLGHDNPELEIDPKFLENDKFWCHAKNIEALTYMSHRNIHHFWHEEDQYTLTSKNFIWTYPERSLTKNSIAVWRDAEDGPIPKNCYGICSDFVGNL